MALDPKSLGLPSPAQLALANMQLRESEEKFRCLSENALDAIVMADAEGNVRFWNSAAERLFGYRPDEILGRSLHEILTPSNGIVTRRLRATHTSQRPEPVMC